MWIIKTKGDCQLKNDHLLRPILLYLLKELTIKHGSARFNFGGAVKLEMADITDEKLRLKVTDMDPDSEPVKVKLVLARDSKEDNEIPF